MRIALAQLERVVGDLEGNVERIAGAVEEAARAFADLVVLPELAVTGYPPEDLLLRPGFVRAARAAVEEIARSCTDTVALVGCPTYDRDLANAAFVCADGSVQGIYRKHFLPNYGVFDEHRYFGPGRELLLLELRGVLIAPTIREDVWQPGPPATDLALAGATLPSTSPPRRSTWARRGSRADARDAGTGQRGLRRVLQPRRRPGRACSTATRSCSTTRAK